MATSRIQSATKSTTSKPSNFMKMMKITERSWWNCLWFRRRRKRFRLQGIRRVGNSWLFPLFRCHLKRMRLGPPRVHRLKHSSPTRDPWTKRSIKFLVSKAWKISRGELKRQWRQVELAKKEVASRAFLKCFLSGRKILTSWVLWQGTTGGVRRWFNKVIPCSNSCPTHLVLKTRWD